MIEVADSGIGIADPDRRRLFERFFRSPHVRGMAGAGLGLAVVKAIVDSHGGSIEVESGEGEGATFRVLLPLRARPAGRVEDAAPRRPTHV